MPGTAESVQDGRQGLRRLERTVLLGALATTLPGLVCGGVTVWAHRLGEPALWAIWISGAIVTGLLVRWQYRRLMFPLHTLLGLLEALREGDYSLRGASTSVLREVMYDFNALADRLQRERLQFEEATHLLGKTLSALDSAVFTFDDRQRLRLANPAGHRLLGAEEKRLFHMCAAELGLDQWLSGSPVRVLSHAFPGKTGRFEVRHTLLRSGGHRGHLLVINDLGRVLREEERLAWQRLLRVLGHEVNNSLAPISSMAGTLSTLVRREPLPPDWREDFDGALDVIADRAASLGRFLASCSRLAQLPPPNMRHLDLYELADRLVRLEQRLPIRCESTEHMLLRADPDQLAQALINLLHNAVEAAQTTGGGVRLRWRRTATRLVIEVEDDGPGPPETKNLFTPFFTTKAAGAGIGLALARHIAEAHEGGLTLTARPDAQGALACLWLPLATQTMPEEAL
ncbi:sensor histidine kinase [Massilia consociata]|uniref:histidine kinase n=1 Tax=Massilia consociata TaxID=760117 RepID=A0ABV6FK20_9BURK